MVKKVAFLAAAFLLIILPAYGDMTDAEKQDFLQKVEAAQTARANNMDLTREQALLLRQVGESQRPREIDELGGPDEFGYFYVDSNEEEGPIYEWVEIRPDMEGEGTGLGLSDDGESGFIPMPDGWSFSFYGVDYNQFVVSPNGWVSFIDENGGLSGTIPSPFTPNATLAPYWRDLDPGDSDEEDAWYWFDEENQIIVIQWFTGNFNGPMNNAKSFEVILDITENSALYQYDTSDEGWAADTGATIGVENEEGTIGLTYDRASLTDELAILWYLGEGDANVSGTVFDGDTHMPVADAVVQFGFNSTTTNSVGEFSLEGIFSAQYNLEVFAQGYVTYAEAVTVEEGENTFNILVDQAQPVGDIFDFEEGPAGFTAAGGAFEHGSPGAGPMSAYSGSNVWATYLNSDYQDSDDATLTSPTITLNGNGIGLGFWAWWEYENGWDGFHVLVSNDGGTSWDLVVPDNGYNDDSVVGLDNQAGFTQTSNGWEYLFFDLSDYNGDEIQIRFRHGSDSIISGYYGVAIDDLALFGSRQFGSLTGFISYFDTGQLVNAATVILYPSGSDEILMEATTESDGIYFFPYLQTGSYRLAVTSPGYEIFIIDPLEITEGLPVVENIQLHPSEATVQFSGTVVSADLPETLVAGATVQVPGLELEAVTDENGAFDFGMQPEGIYAITLTHDPVGSGGYHNIHYRGVVVNDAGVPLELIMYNILPPETLEGTVGNGHVQLSWGAPVNAMTGMQLREREQQLQDVLDRIAASGSEHDLAKASRYERELRLVQTELHRREEAVLDNELDELQDFQGYRIEVDGEVLPVVIAGTSYDLLDLQNGHLYTIRVAADYGYDESTLVFSNEIHVRPLPMDEIPYAILEEFEWIEINPANDGDGTPLNLTDDGPSPFISMGNLSFSHYGNVFSEFCVSPNGWMSFSDAGFDLWPNLPDTFGPFNQVVLYGRDQDPGDSEEEDVYYLVDEAEELVVIQWHTGSYPGPTNQIRTYQLVLDCAMNQYFFNYQSATEGWEAEITVGMQNEDGTAASIMPSVDIADETTVFWAPVTNFGNVTGTVRDADTDEAMEGVRVRVQGAPQYTAFTDETGAYELLLINRDLAPLNLVFQATGYEQEVVEAVEWEGENFDVVADALLTHVSPESPPEFGGYDGDFDDQVEVILREPGSFEGLDMIGPDDGSIGNAYGSSELATAGTWAVPLVTRQGHLIQVELRLAAENEPYLPRTVNGSSTVQVSILADEGGVPGDVLYTSEPVQQGRVILNPDLQIAGPTWVTADGGAICVDQLADATSGFAWQPDASAPWLRMTTTGDPIVRAIVESPRTASRAYESGSEMLEGLADLNQTRGASRPISALETSPVYGRLPVGTAPRAAIAVPVPASLDELDEITFLGYDVYASSDGGETYTQQNASLIEENNFIVTFGSDFEQLEMLVYAVAHVDDSDLGEVVSEPSDTMSVYFEMAPATPAGLQVELGEEEDVYTAELSWSAVTTNADGSDCVDLDGYTIYRDGEVIGSVEAGVTSFSDDPPNDGFFAYSVQAFDDAPEPNASGMSMPETMYVGPTGFFSDLEGGSGDFFGDDRWQYGEPMSPPGTFSGANVLATNLTGNYDNNDYNVLTWDQLWAVEGPSQLVYQHYINYEFGWDGYRVDISTDEGETWELLVPEGGYPDDAVNGIDNGPGFTGSSGEWQQVVFQLGDYSGETVRFRFLHGTDSSVNGYYGVAIDDIYLLGGAGFPDFGSISGVIWSCEAGVVPVNGVAIRLGDSDRIRGYSSFDGSFMIDSVLVGSWDIHFWHDAYWPMDYEGITVTLDENHDMGDMEMMQPDGSVNRTTLEMYVSIGEGMDSTASASIELTSDGCGLLDWSAWLELNAPMVSVRNRGESYHRATAPPVAKREDPSTWRGPIAGMDEIDALWDSLFSFDPTQEALYEGIIAAATTSTGIYAIDQDAAEFAQFTLEGDYVDSEFIPNQMLDTNGNPPKDLAIDPNIGGFYAGNGDGDLFYFSESLTGVTPVGNVGIPVVGIAYDFVENKLYTYGVNDFRRYDMLSGDTEILIPNGSLGTVTGLAYMASDPDGYTIWILRETATGAKTARYNPTTGLYDMNNDALYPSGDGSPGGMEISSAYSTTFYDITTALNRDTGNDQIDIWEGMSTVPPWIHIDGANAGELEPGNSVTINLVADLRGTRLDVEPGMELEVVLYFDGPFWGNPPAVFIPVTLTDQAVGEEEGLPTKYALHQNYPNPFNPATRIKFDLIQAQHVKLAVYNVLGREVARLVDGKMEPGFHAIEFDAARFASGVYFYRLESDAFTSMKKMVLVK
ncbi:carboxypeptidase regulatory-like domain-containing protein [bacterium]|nr:carboxypeptidase regulatory-like domain-containing protein [bacterium]